LDSKYPPWETVFYHFTELKARGIWDEILDSLVIMERKRNRKESTPSLLYIDSQYVKIVQFINQETGIDGGKNVNGRKRTILVDTLGLPFSIKVTAANISDNQSDRRCGRYISCRFAKRKSVKVTKNNSRHGL
jgi:putative transposase